MPYLQFGLQADEDQPETAASPSTGITSKANRVRGTCATAKTWEAVLTKKAPCGWAAKPLLKTTASLGNTSSVKRCCPVPTRGCGLTSNPPGVPTGTKRRAKAI